MPTYRLKSIGPHKRMTLREETRYDHDGNPHVIRTPEDDIIIHPGDLFEPTPGELRAFGDLMEWVSDDPFDPPPPAAQPTRVNPELFSLIVRANAGQASSDEQQIVGDVVRYLEAHAQGTATAEETAALELVLKDFGMPLFVA